MRGLSGKDEKGGRNGNEEDRIVSFDSGRKRKSHKESKDAPP